MSFLFKTHQLHHLLLLSRGACWFREACWHCYKKNIILSTKKSDYSVYFSSFINNGYLHNKEYFLDNSFKIYSSQVKKKLVIMCSKIYFLMKNIVKLYQRNILIVNNSNFCFNILIWSITRFQNINFEYKFNAYGELAMDLRIYKLLQYLKQVIFT